MSSVALLNRLITVHGRSLAVYLASAVPWLRDSQGDAAEVLRVISDDHQRTTDRLAELIIDAGGRIELGGFPMAFTSYHDLSLDYLLTKLISHQQQDIVEIQDVVDAAPKGTLVREIAEEALGAAKGHLESLREISSGCSL